MLLKDIIQMNKSNTDMAIKYANKQLSYQQLWSKSIDISEKLRVSRYYSKNIGIFLPNSIDYAIAYFSITMASSVIVPINIKIKGLELESTINYCELGIIITNSSYKQLLLNFLKDSSTNIVVFNLDDNTFDEIGNDDSKFETNIDKSNEVNEDNVALMLHTSGTTSNPKRVMLTHKNLITNIKSNIESLELTINDKVLIALPMFFGYCNTAQFLTHLYLGASIVIMDGMFMPKEFFKIIENEKITNFTGVPTMLLMLLNYKYRNKYNISTLRYICFGGGLMPVEKLKLLIDAFPTAGFVQTYGQTEASPRVTALLPQNALKKIGSVGKAIPNVKIRIVNELGEDVCVNETGEIIVQGNNIMKGYYKKDRETAETIRNGWLYTGDIGKYDEEGFIYLVGRKKNIIISGGINIYPEEIEELLMSHHAIKDVYVVGDSHEFLGEVPIAKVVLNEGATNVSEKEIIKFCTDNLANYKVPKSVIFENELPKTATGKIKRV